MRGVRGGSAAAGCSVVLGLVMGVDVLGLDVVECDEVRGREVTPGVVMAAGAHTRQLVERG